MIIGSWNVYTTPPIISSVSLNVFSKHLAFLKDQTEYNLNHTFIHYDGPLGSAQFGIIVGIAQGPKEYEWGKYADYGLAIPIIIIKTKENNYLYPLTKGFAVTITDLEITNKNINQIIIKLGTTKVIPQDGWSKLFQGNFIYLLDQTQLPKSIYLKITCNIHILINPIGHIKIKEESVTLELQLNLEQNNTKNK